MLREGYKIRHANFLMLSQIQLLPNMKDDDRIKFMKTLEYASKDPSDILRTRSGNTDMNKIRNILGGA